MSGPRAKEESYQIYCLNLWLFGFLTVISITFYQGPLAPRELLIIDVEQSLVTRMFLLLDITGIHCISAMGAHILLMAEVSRYQ